jgi:hypothetical protein
MLKLGVFRLILAVIIKKLTQYKKPYIRNEKISPIKF